MSEGEYNFQKLTPIKDAKIEVYYDALEFVFGNCDLLNIAITGSYCAGKSSVLNTYIDRNKGKRFLHVSLAHFLEIDCDEQVDSSLSETNLEGKIINQLIHQIEPDRIPQTHFKVKAKTSRFRLLLNTIMTILFSISAIYLATFSYWNLIVTGLSNQWIKTGLNFSTKSECVLIASTICVSMGSVAIYRLVKALNNKRLFKRLSVQGNEIEVFEDSADSYFDKYLNEVLYIFKNSGADAIVFEDIDRHNGNLIFEKLREINYLINRENENPIRFFYLLRDDIFTSKDRTKFFDFIMPIVPIIDSSNSYDQFLELLKIGGLQENFNESFLQGISLYIDDMRLLKNIYNEFVIYYKRIQATELSDDKLLALIIYKNIFPRDFSNLQLGRGFLHAVFANKENIVSSEVQRINNKITEKQKIITSLDKENLKNIDELDALYFSADAFLSVNNKSEAQFSCRTEFLREMKDHPDAVTYFVNNYSYGPTIKNYDFARALQVLSNKPEYVIRKEEIDKKYNNGQEKLKQEILQLREEMVSAGNKKFQKLITKDNINTIFGITIEDELEKEQKFEEVKGNPYFPVIKFLVRNGFIDETYQDYLTYFYENSISRIDKIFLRSVTDEIPKAYDYALINPKRVVTRLKKSDFEHIEIYNIDLLDYLLKEKHPFLRQFLSKLKADKKFDFIAQFIAANKSKMLFISEINRIWPSIWTDIQKQSGYSGKQKDEYIIDTFYASTEREILALNELDGLSDYISNNKDFLNVHKPNNEKIVSGLKILKIQFVEIDYDAANLQLFNDIYKEKLFLLNKSMITLIVEKVYGIPQSNDYWHKNYSILISRLNEPLLTYVNQNLSQYLSLCLENCGEIISDTELAATTLLSKTEIDITIRKQYLILLTTEISDIGSVLDNEIWAELLAHQKVEYSSENIMQYYAINMKVDENLTSYINNGKGTLHFDNSKINERYGEKVLQWWSSLITCNSISDEKYEMILKTSDVRYKTFNFSNIDENKIHILVKLNVIVMNQGNLVFVRENYENCIENYILSNIKIYSESVIEQDNFDYDELLFILGRRDIDDIYKITLLANTTEEIQVTDCNYSEHIEQHIIEYNYDETDLTYYINVYDERNPEFQNAIYLKCVESIVKVIEEKNSIPFNLLILILGNPRISAENRLTLFCKNFLKLNIDEVKVCLSVLQMYDYLSLFEGCRPKFYINVGNEILLKGFKTKRWISSFEVDSKDKNYYRAYGYRKEHGKLR